MQCPTKEQILEAAGTSAEARKAIRKLFPEVFERPVQPGDIFEWGESMDEQGSGMIVEVYNYPGYTFLNFYTGKIYLPRVGSQSTMSDLNTMLQRLPASKLHDCYCGIITGPFRLASWTTDKKMRRR